MLRIISIVVDDDKVWFDDLVNDLDTWLQEELDDNDGESLYTMHLDTED